MTDTQRFLSAAHADMRLAALVRQCTTFAEVAAVARARGFRRREWELRAAFNARQSAVLFRPVAGQASAGSAEIAWNKDLWSRIEALDLEPVMALLVREKGWRRERVHAAAIKFRRFLYLREAAGFPAVPTEELREFCRYRGITGPGGDAAQTPAWLGLTATAYQQIFREPYLETAGEALLRLYSETTDLARAA